MQCLHIVHHGLAAAPQTYSQPKQAAEEGGNGHSSKNATWDVQEAQCAFKDLMIHEDLQFALRIAFRCVLHRCGSLDIRC